MCWHSAVCPVSRSAQWLRLCRWRIGLVAGFLIHYKNNCDARRAARRAPLSLQHMCTQALPTTGGALKRPSAFTCLRRKHTLHPCCSIPGWASCAAHCVQDSSHITLHRAVSTCMHHSTSDHMPRRPNQRPCARSCVRRSGGVSGGERQNSPSPVTVATIATAMCRALPLTQSYSLVVSGRIRRRSSRRRSAEFCRSPHGHVITGLGAIVVVARRSPSAAPASTAPLAVHGQQTHSVSLIDVTVNCSSRRVSGHGVVESTVDMVAVLERVSGRMRVH